LRGRRVGELEVEELEEDVRVGEISKLNTLNES